MKKLSQYSKDVYDYIKDYAIGVIDYLNQEGDIHWDENKIREYLKGTKEPNYEDLVNEMICELEDYGDDNNILPTLKEYDQNKIIIHKILLDAMQEYIDSI